MTQFGSMTVTSYRVSFYDQFVVVLDSTLPPYTRRWALWDLSGIVSRIIEDGVGDPPARLFPSGVVPNPLSSS